MNSLRKQFLHLTNHHARSGFNWTEGIQTSETISPEHVGRDGRTDNWWQSPVAVRRLPTRVNLRARDQDRAGPLVVRENQSRRDLTKVAQYEVLGNEAKNRYVPLASGTNCSLKTLTQHFVLGYFH